MASMNVTRVMRQSHAAAILVITALLLMFVTQAGAETLKGRDAYHITKAEAIKVGDVPGHAVGVAKCRGLTFFDDGEVATLSVIFTYDYTNGDGTHEAYLLCTFEDGSTVVSKLKGTTRAIQGGKYSSFKGTQSYIGGNGRFKGIKGSGSYTGKRVAPVASGADCYRDFTGTYTLSPR